MSAAPGCLCRYDQSCRTDNDSCTPEGAIFGGGICCRGACTTADFIESPDCGACNSACSASEGCGQTLHCSNGVCASCLPLSCAGRADDSPCALAPESYLTPGICCDDVCVSEQSNAHCGACGIACASPEVCNNGSVCGECDQGSECPAGEGCFNVEPFTGGGMTCAQICEGPCPTGSGCETDAGCLPVCPPDGMLPSGCAVCPSPDGCLDGGS